MGKMTIDEAAQKLGVSKEAIHNRIRRGSLESVIEDGVKFVMLDASKTAPTQKRTTTRRASNSTTDRYYKFLEEQNQELHKKVEKLEGETRSLRDQKEQMLIEEKKKIEEIYIQKDEQLKSILSAISSKFMLNAPTLNEEDEHHDAEVEVLELNESEEIQSQPISLKKYLKDKDISKKEKKKIQEKLYKKAKKDDRITIIGEKVYIDPLRYDYSDLLDFI
jgi:valyl-tRNA synthetase